MSPGSRPRPSLSGALGELRRIYEREVSPGSRPRPSLSADADFVRRQARLDAGGAGCGGEAALNLYRGQPDHPIRGCGVGGAKGADRFRGAVFEILSPS